MNKFLSKKQEGQFSNTDLLYIVKGQNGDTMMPPVETATD